MIINCHRRYCYKVGSGGISSVLTRTAELKEKYPDSHISIEFNERSSVNRYRVTRLSQDTIEIPDPPDLDLYPVPKWPRAELIDASDIETTHIPPNSERNYYQSYGTVKFTHIPTGTSTTRVAYRANDGLTRWAREELEQKVDQTYEPRMKEYREAVTRRQDAMNAWNAEVTELIKGQSVTV